MILRHDDDVSTMECPACGSVVPTERFCPSCGADLKVPATPLNVLLRPRVFAAAHREPIWMPRISSTMFPRLPGQVRRPFRLGLILVLVAIIVFASMRMNGPVGVIATLGWPLLFVLFVWESDGFRDIPVRIMAVAMVLGGAIGVGWWLWADRWLAASYGLSDGSGLQLLGAVNIAFLLSTVGGLLMLVPAAVARLIRVPVRESLDGFVVGAAGALCYAMASTATIFAPQFVEGLIHQGSPLRMLHDWIRNGVVNPIITTAAGGLFGLSLWFQPRRELGHSSRRARIALTICTVTAVGIYPAVWAVDGMAIPHALSLALLLGLAVLALLTVRCAVQIALLHEAPEQTTGDPMLCVHCVRVVPDMPFCVACGAAARASSRQSRHARRECPPVRLPSA